MQAAISPRLQQLCAERIAFHRAHRPRRDRSLAAVLGALTAFAGWRRASSRLSTPLGWRCPGPL